jgi:transcriptional regulator of aroF, aroG, tyrA and aromatic amino acid transport
MCLGDEVYSGKKTFQEGRNLRLKINTTDRVGMVLDVLQVFAPFDIDIQAMEVEPGAIYLRFPQGGMYSEVSSGIRALAGVHSIEEISSLPQEQRRREIQAVVEAVGEGLVAIDAQGRVTLLNAAAETILKIKASKVMGKYIGEVLGRDVPMLATLKTGHSYDNQEILINKGPVRTRYMTSGRPLLDHEGRVYGVVASLKDPGQIRDLVNMVTRAPEITFADIIYRSKCMEDLVGLCKQVSGSAATILIYGESGTGKELFARAIHAESPRRDGAFVPINCGALPDSLLESELFGYEDGAFTGSRRGGRMGLFEFGHGGTVFLDEIAEVPTHLQSKLLRALQSGSVRRVGGNEEIQVDVRIIAATNKNLGQLVGEHKFREDLYYRLNVIPLTIPPLRQRREDILTLVGHLLDRRQTSISPEAMAVLSRHRWPGNVRELENVLERAMTIAGDKPIQREHLLLDEGPMAFAGGTLKEQVAELERKLVAEALSRYPSTRRAGEVLGLSHTSVLNKVRRYNLETFLSRRKD